LYKTFASPWADEPVRGEPEFVVPPCYDQKAPQLQVYLCLFANKASGIEVQLKNAYAPVCAES
jgi:hypothetical protein